MGGIWIPASKGIPGESYAKNGIITEIRKKSRYSYLLIPLYDYLTSTEEIYFFDFTFLKKLSPAELRIACSYTC
jgi:hypothetical protein